MTLFQPVTFRTFVFMKTALQEAAQCKLTVQNAPTDVAEYTFSLWHCWLSIRKGIQRIKNTALTTPKGYPAALSHPCMALGHRNDQ